MSNSTRYCIHLNSQKSYQIWDKTTNQWLGNPSKEFPIVGHELYKAWEALNFEETRNILNGAKN